MLTLNCLGSGSSGNCYLLSDDKGRILILDCGVKIAEVKKALNFNLTNICGVFATHGHMDHFLSYKDFVKMGCECFAPHTQGKIRENRTLYPYSLQAFQLPHGQEETSYGVLIRHLETKESMLYMTDFAFSRYNFNGCRINHFLIECNYQDKYVDREAPNFIHKISGHCGLETLLEFIKANETEAMRSVIACHLGDTTADSTEVVNSIKEVVRPAVMVDYARKFGVYELR